MSLFKASKLNTKLRSFDAIRNDFVKMFDRVVDADKVTKDDVAILVSLYAEFGVVYMRNIAITLEDNTAASASMKFMNSIIAEAVSQAGLHYFDLDRGYSVVDKAVQAALDAGGIVAIEAMLDIINTIEKSYEPSEEELEALEDYMVLQ